MKKSLKLFLMSAPIVATMFMPALSLVIDLNNPEQIAHINERKKQLSEA